MVKTMVETVFSHVGVMCKNPIETERFYEKYFGFKRSRVYLPGPNQVVMLKLGDIYLELFKAEEERPFPEPTEAGPKYPCWRHLCFMVNDLDAKLKEIDGDAKITLGPLDLSEFVPGMKVVWLRDPEGNIIEINQGYRDEENPPALEE